MGFFNLKICLLSLPLVDTVFSAAGADLYLVFLSQADLRWISCLLCLLCGGATDVERRWSR